MGNSIKLCWGSIWNRNKSIYGKRLWSKPYRRAIIESYGGSVVASPSNETNSGRALEKDPNSSGSLGIAISEAAEVAATNDIQNMH